MSVESLNLDETLTSVDYLTLRLLGCQWQALLQDPTLLRTMFYYLETYHPIFTYILVFRRTPVTAMYIVHEQDLSVEHMIQPEVGIFIKGCYTTLCQIPYFILTFDSSLSHDILYMADLSPL